MFKVIRTSVGYDYEIYLQIINDNKIDCISNYTFNGYVTDEIVISNEINKVAEFTFELIDEHTVKCKLSAEALNINAGEYKYLIDYTDNSGKKFKLLSGVIKLSGLYE